MFSKPFTLKLENELVSLETPIVMGILNTTPDSFFDGGKYNSIETALLKVEKMLSEGADIIDVGGASSKPNANEVTEEEELSRTIPIIKEIKKKYPGCKISIDTFRSKVAKEAINAGSCMVNDISGGNFDKNIWQVVADAQVAYVLMHMRGTPQTMQSMTEYQDLEFEILNEIQTALNQLKKIGVCDIVLDLGFGFAKNLPQNYRLLKNLSYFEALNLPLLVGISRKSMIYKLLEINPDFALNGTTALHMVALQNGASILRVHDVKEAKECIKLYKYINS